MNIIESNIELICVLCIKYNVKHLYAFGSVLTDRFQSESDVDLIVDFNNIDLYDYADNYFDFKGELEKLFERDVDLLEVSAIKNPYLRQTIEASKQLIYG
jgi:predicted nucleotidyltransferase